MLEVGERPSKFIGVEDDYTAFCFDEAVAWIVGELRDGREPIFAQDTNSGHYSRPSDFYKKFET